MEIKKIFIVAINKENLRFVRIYWTGARYFYQIPAGAIKEITAKEFELLSKNTE